MPRVSTTKKSSESSTHRKEDFIFFWTTNHVNGWASQWYPAAFTATVVINGEEETHEFPTTEHWMMLQKALLFSDIEIARKVLGSTSTDKKAMAQVKGLGRKVKNFNDAVWKKNRERIVLEGTVHKFRQNKELLEELLGTGDKEIAEASPRDRIWGIGCGEKNAIERIGKWGTNLLGKALVQARNILREENQQTAGHNAVKD
ncbi:hypothetical protein BDZ94DRAFT_422923 [Collybia nuda]|uniref:NADAR domain-containing protein n=1 Tax=Collybia nuda TaxID=64659 RepID=A0A9P6C8P2_9AGAR|nr:hypothetical protein BDZ94DRAFT_422923 [Collybia nuda]